MFFFTLANNKFHRHLLQPYFNLGRNYYTVSKTIITTIKLKRIIYLIVINLSYQFQIYISCL